MGLVYLPTIWLNFMVYVGKYTVRPMGYGVSKMGESSSELVIRSFSGVKGVSFCC